MSNVLKGSVKETALLPINKEGRIFDTVRYTLIWWSSIIAVQSFVLGQSMLPPIGQLNFLQASIVVILSAVLMAVAFSLNGDAGLKYGIPFTVHCRPSFGFKGTNYILFLRIIPAVVWYGVGSWIAALSANGIIMTLTGFSSDAATFVYFLIFQVFQTYFAYKGIEFVGWFNTLCSVVIFAVMIWIMINILNMGFSLDKNWIHPGTWGTPFWYALTACTGVMSAVMLNSSDMTRFIKPKQTTNWIGHIIGVVPSWAFMVFLGVLSGATLGIWDPIQALMTLSPNAFVTVVLLVFILLAQFSSNLTLNIMPFALVLMQVFKFSWFRGVLIAGILGVFTMPWFILGNMDVYMKFIAYYSSLYGPALGVMLADYWVISKRKYDVEHLYTTNSTSKYWYNGGYNLGGLLSVLLAGLISMIWFLPASWLVGLPLGFVFYLISFPAITKKMLAKNKLTVDPTIQRMAP